MNIKQELHLENQYTISKYFTISLVLSIVSLIIFLILSNFAKENTGNMILFWATTLSMFVFATYTFSIYYLNGIFYKNKFKKDQMIIVNSQILIPIVNIKFLFQLMDKGNPINLFIAVFLLMFAPYTIYYFIANGTKFHKGTNSCT